MRLDGKRITWVLGALLLWVVSVLAAAYALRRVMIHNVERTVTGMTVMDAREQDLACPVHGGALLLDVVSVRYGLIRVPREQAEAERKHFPCARTEALGGCLRRPWQEALVLYCPECRRTKGEWRPLEQGEARQEAKPQPADSRDG
ncbi:MAG: hypothetical protein HN742_02475 [Lentisphaerae bacterium]|mgnify:CR=1 FL=1|jgi:hypothetical protein|nr:hypothetical protein [Lentisphaerota bacterium]MBT4816285.1 hypothetical protein [Lentisphaerota bacterium]MBT5610921.1 hypothetical protein [Lentisphaerota bacterium]MBT7053438.1 hypothetical protein [Lentisphaerota bacterium]MBT7840704.1 hypothetical protein [Lentisphaerota bacterium]